MTVPAYVSPDQWISDRADFARRGVGRGYAVVVARCADGICMVAHNPSRSLHQTSEIHDRIGFAAVGRYNEYEQLRVAGIRLADIRAYAYGPLDVTGLALATTYAQVIGANFASMNEKPYEVELAVAELGRTRPADQIFRISWDGSVSDGIAPTVLGPMSQDRRDTINEFITDSTPLDDAVRCAAAALTASSDAAIADELEVSILDPRTGGRRTFRRLGRDRVRAFWSAS
ncbi:MAG: proteasome subunit alpha [Acidipropionibacterium sp.]|jgi:proteasome alpha subunit|nr:proteasome subunit alpha [Acidipropionibacterium sp.]